MKIGIITHYDVHNHGALLQLNALVQIMRKIGHEVFALRFEKSYDFLGLEQKAKYELGIRSVVIYADYLYKCGFKKTIFNIRKKMFLNKFKKQNDLIGGYYTEVGELDAVCVGSDEVFALHTGPTPVFFGHCLPSDFIFAYAASFGPTCLEDIQRLHSEEFVKSGISCLKNISVRDGNSADIIKKLIGVQSEIVCDPVLLYGYSEEIYSTRIPLGKPYLLVYAYDNNMNSAHEVQAIRSYARSHELRILSVGFYHDWCDENINVTPIELMSWVKLAKAVVTDTFHGSVISILTNTEFIAITRNNSNKLANLLLEYRLENRLVKELAELKNIFEDKIDWDVINNEILRRRKTSMRYLMDCLEESVSE